MNIRNRIITFIDRLLDLFNIIKGCLNNALAVFEKLKDRILTFVQYVSNRINTITERELEELEEEHFFI